MHQLKPLSEEDKLKKDPVLREMVKAGGKCADECEYLFAEERPLPIFWFGKPPYAK